MMVVIIAKAYLKKTPFVIIYEFRPKLVYFTCP